MKKRPSKGQHVVAIMTHPISLPERFFPNGTCPISRMALVVHRAKEIQLALALMLAIWTSQRQGDLLRLPWSAYDGTHIRLQQSKTGRAHCDAPAGALLDMTERGAR